MLVCMDAFHFLYTIAILPSDKNSSLRNQTVATHASWLSLEAKPPSIHMFYYLPVLCVTKGAVFYKAGLSLGALVEPEKYVNE